MSGKWGEGAGEFAGVARVLSVDGEGGGSGSQDTCATSGREKGNGMIPDDVTGLEISSVFVLTDSCIFYSKDTIKMGKSHILNFISSDCTLNSNVNKELVNANILDANLLKQQNLPLGHVTVLASNGRYVFNVVIREKGEDKPFLNIISGAISRLKQAMEILKVTSVKVSKVGNDLDQISWISVEQIIRQHFSGSGLRVCVCSSEIQFPPKENRERIIRESHESTIGGHKGVSKTYWRIRGNFYWKNLKLDVENFVRLCRKCQENKLVRIKNRQPMKITDTPTQPFDKIQIDIVGPLPETESGNKYILTIQDNFSKYSDAIPLASINAISVAHALAEEFISRYGCPRVIHSDQGSNFTSNIMKTFCKIFNIERVTSTAFHPQSLGSLERSHITLIEYLKVFATKQNWDQWLRYAVFCYNTSVHESTGFTPYVLVFGREPRLPSGISEERVPPTYVEYMKELFRKIGTIQSTATENLIAAKRRSKRYYDVKTNPQNFQVGDSVYLLNEPRVSKLDAYYKGPYILERLLGNSNAEIRITTNKTKIVHLDKLKLAAFPVLIETEPTEE